jgi:hypothetical protein
MHTDTVVHSEVIAFSLLFLFIATTHAKVKGAISEDYAETGNSSR